MGLETRKATIVSTAQNSVKKDSLTVVHHVERCMILQVGSNTWEVDDNWDTERLEGLLRSDTRKLQNLRGVQGSGGDNDLLGSKDLR